MPFRPARPLPAAATAFAAALLAAAPSTPAAEVVLNGPGFDFIYDDAPFVFRTGSVFDPDTGTEEDVFERLGGFSLAADGTVRLSLAPRFVETDSSDPSVLNVIPGNIVEIDGSSFDAFDDGLEGDIDVTVPFRVVPRGALISGVNAVATGSVDAPSDSDVYLAGLGLTANGVTDAEGFSFSQQINPLTLEAAAAFTATGSAFTGDVSVDISGQSSSGDVSRLQIDGVTLTLVPEPAAAAPLGVGLLAVARRRR